MCDVGDGGGGVVRVCCGDAGVAIGMFGRGSESVERYARVVAIWIGRGSQRAESDACVVAIWIGRGSEWQVGMHAWWRLRLGDCIRWWDCRYAVLTCVEVTFEVRC